MVRSGSGAALGSLSVTSRKVVWPLPEELGRDFVPVLYRLQGRSAKDLRLGL